MPLPEKPSTLGVSPRRSACDRCRGQKLRCLREDADPDGRCDRCAKARAQCITSPIYHMRNIFAHTGTHDDSLARSTSVNTKSKRKRQKNSKENDPIPQSAPIPASTASKPSLSVVSPSTSTSTSGTNATMPSSFFDPSFPESFTTPAISPNWNWSVDPVTPQVPVPGSPLVGNLASSWDAGDMNLENILSGLDKAADQSNYSQSPFGGQSLETRPSSHEIPTASYDEPVSEPVPAPNLGPSNSSAETNETSEVRYDYMEELSRLNLNLATQIRRMQEPFVTLKTLIISDQGDLNPLAVTPLENILNATRHFLDVLSIVAGSAQSSVSSASSDQLQLSKFHLGNSNSPTSTSASLDDSSQSSASSPSSSHPRDTSVLKARPDNALLLLILLCYIHILKLHVALFAHIEVYLQIISDSDERVLNPLPRLGGFSNIPLDSGNLQATMIIQLVTNMFEKMESLLGLPRELCIRRREDSQNGLFRVDSFLEFAQSMIQKEDIGRPEAGKGGIKSLRRNMRKAKQLLRSRIAP